MHCHSRPFPVLVPDHEIGQLSCLPYSSASYDLWDCIALSFSFLVFWYSETESRTPRDARSLAAQTDFKTCFSKRLASRALAGLCYVLGSGVEIITTEQANIVFGGENSVISKDCYGNGGSWLCLSSISRNNPGNSCWCRAVHSSIWWDFFYLLCS